MTETCNNNSAQKDNNGIWETIYATCRMIGHSGRIATEVANNVTEGTPRGIPTVADTVLYLQRLHYTLNRIEQGVQSKNVESLRAAERYAELAIKVQYVALLSVPGASGCISPSSNN